MAQSLSVLASKNFTLQQLVDIGFNLLPTNQEFYVELLKRMKQEQLAEDYEEMGWSFFEKDILSLIKNEGQPLIYDYISLYWRQKGDKYIMDAACEANNLFFDEKSFDTLDEVIGYGVFLLRVYNENTEHMEIGENAIPPETRKIFEMMWKEKEEHVEKIMQELVEKGSLKITSPLSNLSFYPFTETSGAVLILDVDKLTLDTKIVVVGYTTLKNGDEEPEYGGQNNASYAIQFTGEDVKLILTILAYNENDYEFNNDKQEIEEFIMDS